MVINQNKVLSHILKKLKFLHVKKIGKKQLIVN